MDEILEQFHNTVGIDAENENRTLFDGLYKNWGKLSCQEKRRKDLLKSQKRYRTKNVDICRGVMELVNQNGERADETHYWPSIYVPGFSTPAYRNVLMLSEWMVEKPDDFEKNWYVVPCPKGVRTLVVASRGKTKCYTKQGVLRTICRTALPGGNPCDGYKKEQLVILDCMHVESVNTMYILDILAWNRQPMSDGETEFRHFWLTNYLGEINELQKLSKKNRMLFKILPKVNCDSKSFNEFMTKMPHFENFTPQLDGLLFYHKYAQYVAGQTPLVGWLYPYMVNEVIGPGVTVNAGYMIEKPVNYINLSTFIKEFEERKKKKYWPRNLENNMDISTEKGYNNMKQLEEDEATNPSDLIEPDDPEDSKEMDTCASIETTSPNDPANINDPARVVGPENSKNRDTFVDLPNDPSNTDDPIQPNDPQTSKEMDT